MGLYSVHQCRGTGVDYKSKLAEWDSTYLAKAKKRLQENMQGYNLSFMDVKDMVSAVLDINLSFWLINSLCRWKCVLTR